MNARESQTDQQRTRVRKACIVGGGVIGGGWVARFLLHGWNVSVYDPHPKAQTRVLEVLDNARRTMPALADVPMPAEGVLHMAETLEAAVSGAQWIQESVPENLSLKAKVLKEIESHASDAAIIASSTSGFRPSKLQHDARKPERIVVAHPFNPVYLLPLVELVSGEAASTETTECARAILSAIGMKVLVVRKEIDAHIADRLLEAVWREALWLINDGIATTEEVDDAIRYGFGLRWAQMGLFETYRLAGGEDGMAHFIKQFGPALKWPWTKLMDVPDLSDVLVDKIATQSDAQSGAYDIRELERIRDRNLIGMLRALKERNWGAGALLNKHDKSLAAEYDIVDIALDYSKPLRMLELTVLPGWIDYNGHMTEFRYLQVFSDTCDRLLVMIGMDKDYVASGRSYFTVETHIMHVDEVAVDQEIYSTSQVLFGDSKRLHVFHCIHAAKDDRLLASAEQMYLHVDRESGRVCEAGPEVLQRVLQLAEAHSQISRPVAAGRYVGER